MHEPEDIMRTACPNVHVPAGRSSSAATLAESCRQGGNAVLVAPPGAGKSTVVPLALAARALGARPEDPAAGAAATGGARGGRAAWRTRCGERVGETVGYRMRLDTRVGPRTRLEVVTEGILTRMLQQDAALEGVAAVLFDEFHERSLHADLGLVLCREAQDSLGLPLQLLVMSATIDGAAVATRLGDAPVIEAQGRMFPVERALPGQGRCPCCPSSARCSPRDIEALAAQVRRVLDDTDGDVLVFLPGSSGDPSPARAAGRRAHSGPRRACAVWRTRHGGAAAACCEPAPRGRRKLILATNIAETSLTIEGVRVVIDTGLARRSLFDPGTGMERLVTVRISQASRAQRAGRAGRTAPGSAWRLWGEGAQARWPRRRRRRS